VVKLVRVALVRFALEALEGALLAVKVARAQEVVLALLEQAEALARGSVVFFGSLSAGGRVSGAGGVSGGERGADESRSTSGWGGGRAWMVFLRAQPSPVTRSPRETRIRGARPRTQKARATLLSSLHAADIA
jgi:hypothetical protein